MDRATAIKAFTEALQNDSSEAPVDAIGFLLEDLLSSLERIAAALEKAPLGS